MVTVYCSQKLERLLRPSKRNGRKLKFTQKDDPESLLGNWNGYAFQLYGKQCVVFLNTKTCYSVVCTHVRQKTLNRIEHHFKERLIRQLYNDFLFSELVEISIRRELAGLQIFRTSGDPSIDGLIKDTIQNLRFYISYCGFFGGEEEESGMAYSLNCRPVTAKVWALGESDEDFSPIDGMKSLMNIFRMQRVPRV